MPATVRMDGDGIFARSAFCPQSPVFPGDAPDKLARMYPSPHRVAVQADRDPARFGARREWTVPLERPGRYKEQGQLSKAR